MSRIYRYTLLIAMFAVTAGCTKAANVSAETRGWECHEQECKVAFVLESEASADRTVAYVVRAHRISKIPGGDGAQRNEVVGESRGSVQLHPMQKLELSERVVVLAKPTQVVTTAWVSE